MSCLRQNVGLERDKDDIHYLPAGEDVVGAISDIC